MNRQLSVASYECSQHKRPTRRETFLGGHTGPGSMLPFILRRFGLDPATSSAPFVATLVDVTGLVIYFSVELVLRRGTLH